MKKEGEQMSLDEIVGALRALGKFGVFIGRLNPMQLGHQFQVEVLTAAFPEHHILMLGSCNQPVSVRHLFNYADRSDFVHAVHPNTRIAPLPDFGNNELWFRAVDHLIELAGGKPEETVFLGGSQEDVQFYSGTGRTYYIVNRYSGTTLNVSGAEIRDDLIEKRSLDGKLDPRVIPLVRERFALRWKEIREK